MPISSNVFVRSTALLLLVGFLALMGIVGTTIWLVQQNQTWFDQTTEARLARSVVVNLRNALQDAETGQRGYLLTGEERYLEPYNRSVPEVPALLDRVKEVLAPYPEEGDAVAKLGPAVTDKLDELAETIALQRSGDVEGALNVVRTDRGKAAMDEARALFDGVIEMSDTRILTGIENQRNATNGLRWVTIIGAFVIFAVVGGSVWTAMTYTRELAQARQEVVDANASLEDRVRERTSDLGRANE